MKQIVTRKTSKKASVKRKGGQFKRFLAGILALSMVLSGGAFSNFKCVKAAVKAASDAVQVYLARKAIANDNVVLSNGYYVSSWDGSNIGTVSSDTGNAYASSNFVLANKQITKGDIYSLNFSSGKLTIVSTSAYQFNQPKLVGGVSQLPYGYRIYSLGNSSSFAFGSMICQVDEDNSYMQMTSSQVQDGIAIVPIYKYSIYSKIYHFTGGCIEKDESTKQFFPHNSGNVYTNYYDTGFFSKAENYSASEGKLYNSVVYTTYVYAGTVPMPARTGYTFQGWSETSGGSLLSSSQLNTFNHGSSDGDVYAVWESNQYMVSFDTQGGSCGESNKTVYYEQSYGELPTPTRTGYTFDGWWTSASGGNQITSSSVFKGLSNQTVYAHWKVNSHSISYIVNNKTEKVVSGIPYGTKLSQYNPADPSVIGYTFTGWDMPEYMPDYDVRAIANFQGNSYTLTFKSDGKAVQTQSVAYGTAIVAPTGLTKSGYTFSGWDKTLPATMPACDLEFHAVWAANKYTLKFEANGGDCSQGSAEITFGQAMGELPTPTHTGYTFDGWYTSANGGTIVTKDTICSTAGDITIYAHWTPLYKFDASSKTFYIYSQARENIAQWNSDAAILGAKKIVLGKMITDVVDIPFTKFNNLEEITVDFENTIYTSENGLLYSSDKRQLIYCPAQHADNPVISEKCETIKEGTFSATSTVNKVILPYSVQTLENYAFDNSSVKEISIKAFDMDIEESAINKSTKINVFKGSSGEKYAEDHHITYTLYTMIDDGFFEGTGMESFTVPDNIKSIGNEAFRSCTNLKEIVIPESVKYIGNYAFAGDTLIEELELSGAASIGENAFSGMTGLKDVTLSENITKIGTGAFRGCTALSKIFIDNMTCEIAQDDSTIPETVTIQCYAGSTAEKYAVSNNNPVILMIGYEKDGITDYTGGESTNLLAGLMMGDGLQSIGDNAFEGAENLTEVTFPSSVEKIGSGAFAGCENLEKADLSGCGVKEFPEEVFLNCVNLKEVGYGNVEKIGKSAFEGCTSLPDIILTDTVSEIGEDAFKDCAGAGKIFVENQNCKIFDSENTLPSQTGMTGYANSTANVYAEKYNRTFASKGNAYIVSFDTQGGTDGTERVYAVNGKEMPEIAIPKKTGWEFGGYYTSIEGGGICYYDQNGASVKEWDMTGGKTLYAKWTPQSHTVTFHAAGGVSEESRKLKAGEIYGTLPAATREGYLFLGWYTEIEGGSSVSENDIMGEEDITLYAHWSEKLSENSIPAGFLKGNEEIREITIPKGVVTICRNAFRGCSKLEKVNLPDTVTTIEEGAFAEDIALSKISLSKVKKLGDNVFEGTALESVVLEKGCVHLGKEIFKDSALTSVVFKSDVNEITQGMFYGCEKLESVTIDSPATVVGESAFEGSGVKVITLPKSIEQVGKRAFAGCAYLEKVIIENKDCSIFDSADTFTGGTALSGYRASTTKDFAEKFDYNFEEYGLSYKISFDIDGGENKQAAWYAYENDSLRDQVTVPKKEGYDFQGYYAEDVQMYDEEGKLTDASYTVQNDLQMKAKWEKVKDTKVTTPSPSVSPKPSSSPLPSGTIEKDILSAGKLKYKVTRLSGKTGTVSVVGVKSKKVSKLSVPSTVKINGFTFKVTEVGAKAFKGCKKLKSLTLGKNIRKIGKKAFFHDKKLKKVAVKSRKLKAIGKSALKGISRKAVIRIPKSKKKAYRKLFTKKTGFTRYMTIRKLPATKKKK